jgi:hypothetical protein
LKQTGESPKGVAKVLCSATSKGPNSLPLGQAVKVKKFNQARVNGGSNYDSLN